MQVTIAIVVKGKFISANHFTITTNGNKNAIYLMLFLPVVPCPNCTVWIAQAFVRITNNDLAVITDIISKC
ncbi:hypothetical protein E6P70_05945 [Moraxella nonliquefaciens]|nr:hypothetical protein [Moraxella nonliquefaciens]MDI4500145.1 hypothetical protein [Moraxella nonliquefaciens]